jgi:hypothetical protein
MNIYRLFPYFYKFLDLIVLQLQLGLFLFPCYLKEGIPWTFLGILGNIIWAPILTGFLFISFIIYCLILFGFTSFWLFLILDKYTNCWIWSMQWGKNYAFLIYIPYRSWSIYICWGFLLILLFYRPLKKNKVIYGFLTIIGFLCILGILKYVPQYNNSYELAKNINIIYQDKKIYINDERNRVYNKKYDYFWKFTICKKLAIEYGNLIIENYKILKKHEKSPYVEWLKNQLNIKKIEFV